MSPPPSSGGSRIPHRLIVIAGTYDGVLAGWDTNNSSSSNSGNVDKLEKEEEESVEVRLLRKMNDGKYLKLLFAMSAHEGSVRCIDIASSISATTTSTTTSTGLSVIEPGTLLSGGYDESINVYNIRKKNQIGELRTPPDLGSPTCCSFAPPSNNNNVILDAEDGEGDEVVATNQTSTHAVIGTTSGKIIIYKRRDWSVQHILSGHGGGNTSTSTSSTTSSAASGSGGVACLAIHPTGKMALSGGRSDGKIILWDLVKGRLAYVHKIPNNKSTSRNNGNSNNGRRTVECINHIVWSNNGTRYAYCYGSHITARDANTGETLLDVNMYPCPRVNQLTFVGGNEGLFVAAACDDGSLPVLEVGRLLLDDVNDDDDDHNDDDSMKKEDKIRRAIMAIEPVSGPIAGDDRFKCIRSVVGGSGFLVVTANSGGVISLMDLEGAARMMLTPNEENEEEDEEDDSVVDKDDDDSDIDSDDDDEEVEAAVEIFDSVRVGSGARITDLAVWSYGNQDGGREEDDDNVGDSIDEGDDDDENESLDSDEVSSVVNGDEDEKGSKLHVPPTNKQLKYPITKAKGQRYSIKEQTIELNAEAIEKARKLVGQAKEHQKKATKKRKLSNK
jgi:WD40 repeat protein